jgi:hypothetical protein
VIRNKKSCGVYVNSSTEPAPQRYESPQKKLNVVPAYEALLVASNPRLEYHGGLAYDADGKQDS